MGPDRLSRNVGKKKKDHYALHNNPEVRSSHEVSCPAIQSAADSDSIIQAVANFAVGVSSSGVNTSLA